MQYQILIVDDDELNLKITSQFLSSKGFTVLTAQTKDEVLKKVSDPTNEFALVILDYQLKNGTGAEVADELLELKSDLQILMYSGFGTTENIRSTFKSGAVDFITKGSDPQDLLDAVQCYVRKYEQTLRTVTFQNNPQTENEKIIASIGMIGRSAALAEVVRRTIKFQEVDNNVLILGETGTGKELVARAIHYGGQYKDKPFVALNCGAIPENLIESELFGYEKGAFSGAIGRKIGLLEYANGGSVFLDEIHHLSHAAQAKLLRALNDKKIRRLGSVAEHTASFRLIAASKPNLEELSQTGKFIPDLYFRLRVLRIEIPPLRERRLDIEPLVAHFCKKFSLESGKTKQFYVKTVRYLEEYDWPGNVRELENMIQEVLTTTDADKIEPHHLDARIFSPQNNGDELSYDEFSKLLEKREREYLNQVMSNSHSKEQAAKKIGVPVSTFKRRLAKLNLFMGAEPQSE